MFSWDRQKSLRRLLAALFSNNYWNRDPTRTELTILSLYDSYPKPFQHHNEATFSHGGFNQDYTRASDRHSVIR